MDFIIEKTFNIQRIPNVFYSNNPLVGYIYKTYKGLYDFKSYKVLKSSCIINNVDFEKCIQAKYEYNSSLIYISPESLGNRYDYIRPT